MLGTQLINLIDINNKNQRRKIFFLIGDMYNVRGKILDYWDNSSALGSQGATLCYNGVTLVLRTDEIPEAIKQFVSLGIDIYGVYELYEPR